MKNDITIKTIKNIKTRLKKANRNIKIKTIVDFDESNCNNVKSLSI